MVYGQNPALEKEQALERHGADIGGPDPDEERDPPPVATAVTFPHYDLGDGRSWTLESPPPHFRSLFAKVLKPTDISDQHAQALNIHSLPECSFDELVPLATDGTTYLPSIVPDTFAPNDISASDSSAAAARKRKDLEERLAELRIDNDLAFRVLNRNVALGAKPPKLAYMRKFWEGLESMSQYWDCSLDQYYEALEPATEEEQTAKRQRLETSLPNDSDGEEELPNFVDRWPPGQNEDLEQIQTSESSKSTLDHEDEASRKQERRMRYKGRRSATGRAMPDQFRADMVKGFVEGTIWPFRTSLSLPRLMPIVQFGKLNLPVRQTAAVYRLPNERMKARQGWLEGPILSVQVRSDTDFRTEYGQPIEDKSRLDLMRELGGLLQLAQERRREGRTEIKPGEGQWWTTNPRWGGGPGGEVQNEDGNSDIVAAAEEALDADKENKGEKEKDASNSRKRRAPVMLWKELRAGRGYWDSKTDYKAIGTDTASDYDTVFLVSSLNHHISIIKMMIHRAYMDCVTTGTLPDPLPEDSEWCRPYIQRSQWFDLFDKDERLEAFRGLWGVMAYLTRQNESEAKAGS